MHVTRSVAVCLSLMLATPVLAQGWAEFTQRDLQFSINFPATPDVQDTTFTTARGTAVPAKLYSAATDVGRYSILVVDFTKQPWEQLGAIDHAAAMIRKKGKPRYDEPVDLDGIPGHTISFDAADGRYGMVAIYNFDGRLYVSEASVPRGATPPSQFQQSIVIYDRNGGRVNLRPPNAPQLNRPAR
jgi:hypothetical protein